MREQFPEKGFVDQFELYRKRRPSVTLVVNRDVVNPMLIRNTSEDRAETQNIGGVMRAQANGEKFISKERLKGLDTLRMLSEEHGEFSEDSWGAEPPETLISPEYKYNEPAKFDTTLNLDSLTYGIAGTGDQEFGVKSRVIEGYTYSSEEYDLMNKEVRNAAYESGTMQDEDGNQSQALFEHVKVHPNNSFLHFITLEAGTPEMFLYVLNNVLNTNRYGARETRSGKTMENNVLAVILGNQDTSLSTAEYLSRYDEDQMDKTLPEYIKDASRADWEVYSDEFDRFDNYPSWFNEAYDVAAWEKEDAKEILYENFEKFTQEAYEELHDMM